MDGRRYRWIVDVLTALGIIGGLVCCGLIWAVGSIAAGAAMDGVPAEYYDGGNRFAFAVALVLMCALCPFLSLAGYFFARTADLSGLRAFAGSQVPVGIVAAAM